MFFPDLKWLLSLFGSIRVSNIFVYNRTLLSFSWRFGPLYGSKENSLTRSKLIIELALEFKINTEIRMGGHCPSVFNFQPKWMNVVLWCIYSLGHLVPIFVLRNKKSGIFYTGKGLNTSIIIKSLIPTWLLQANHTMHKTPWKLLCSKA